MGCPRWQLRRGKPHAAAQHGAVSRPALAPARLTHWPHPLASSTSTKASFILSSSWPKAQLPSLLARLTGAPAALQSGVAALGCLLAVLLSPPALLPGAQMEAGPLGGTTASGETQGMVSCTGGQSAAGARGGLGLGQSLGG